ncbi:peptidylprolyl isomerase [uncultured Sulfitobacter sp.]|uniref:peptidylprolyl isomerase n=1 Tax=uncultured Sulfitobacter sp. TaxID=191468 RepID=UPI0026267245|nr:peptidylprolyl isomerase [uncultured Sulfitobacter sp.]
MAKKSSLSKTAMWIIVALLFVGLGGFGAVNLNGNLRTIGTVGELPITVDTYAREMQQELRAIGQQTGRAMSFQEAQQIGLDRAVLQRILRDRALDHEAAQMGLSIGDETLRDRIVSIPTFQGVDGNFDRDGYAQALRQAGLSETEFEISLREETARQLLQGAILSGVEMPASYAQTLVGYIGETRDFTWTLLEEEDLESPVGTPDAGTLQAYFEANADSFVLPASKAITYAWLNPADIIDEIELPEADLRAEYEARSAQYDQPERRLIERLVFADQEAADQATAALEVGGTTFETLVADRGLQLSDVDMGDMGRAELGAAGEAVFAADVGDIVGPAPSPLGPALFRVNAILPAQNISFEEAEPELRDALATDRAIRIVESQAEDLDDRLAGGATLEQLAEETNMTLGQIDWTEDSTEDLAAYEGFREAAAAVVEGAFPQIRQLGDGGLFAMRLDEALPERPALYDEVAGDVADRWRADEIVARLGARAQEAAEALEGGTTLPELGLDARVDTGQTRDAFITGTPAGFMSTVFDMEVGDVEILEGEETVVLVRLDAVNPAEETEEMKNIVARLREQQNQELSRNLFELYANDTLARAGQAIDQRAISAVNVNFQ